MTMTSETLAASRGYRLSRGRRSASNEPLLNRVRRLALACAWSLKPPRLWGVPNVLWMTLKHAVNPSAARNKLPNPETALSHPEGLVGICPDLRVETLISGYRAGLFQLCHVRPYKWWAPDPRMVLRLSDFHMEKNLRRRLRSGKFKVTFDQAFEDVLRGCAEPRPGKYSLTWITEDIIDAYAALHAAGYAHSVEVWDEEGNLAGGVIGFAIGKVFFTETQFARQRDASKVGFATLACHLQRWGFAFNDGKCHSNHLAQAGFQLIPRSQFNALLARYCSEDGDTGPWTVDENLDVGNWDPRSPDWDAETTAA
ncbi:MAG: leucyl/phenylalanyl-tRNA--protein transferase [Pseudomonadota bacterium]